MVFHYICCNMQVSSYPINLFLYQFIMLSTHFASFLFFHFTQPHTSSSTHHMQSAFFPDLLPLPILHPLSQLQTIFSDPHFHNYKIFYLLTQVSSFLRYFQLLTAFDSIKTIKIISPTHPSYRVSTWMR